MDLIPVWCHFLSSRGIFIGVSCKADWTAPNYLFFSWNVLVYPLFLKRSFADPGFL